MSYTYTDRDGFGIEIRRSEESGCARVIPLASLVDIPAADLPKVVAELYKAAGQDPPVVHRHTDGNGDSLIIRPSFDLPNTACVMSTEAVWVVPKDLPGLVAKLYEAAGQQPPILLPRPTVEDLRAHGWVDGNEVNSPIPSGKIPPGVARNWAAWLAASADLAEAEPSPEQVKQLAALIEEHAGWDSADLAARAVLRAGYTRSES